MRRTRCSGPGFDHGAALRVPPVEDAVNWGRLWSWLGAEACWTEGGLQVATPDGMTAAQPGDWIVLSVSGHFHVARDPARRLDS